MHSIKRLFLNQIRCYASAVEPKQTSKLCVFIGHLMIERQKSLGIQYDATFLEKYKLYINTDKNKQISISNTIRLKHEIRTFIFDKLPEIAEKDKNEAQEVKNTLDKTMKKLSDPTTTNLGRDIIKSLIDSYILHKHPLTSKIIDIVIRSGDELSRRGPEINAVIFLNPDVTLEEVGMYVEDRYHKDIHEICEELKIESENIIGSTKRLIYEYRMIMLYKNKNQLPSLLQDRSFIDDVSQAHYGWCKSLEYLNQQCVVGDDHILETLEKTIYNIDLLAHKLIEELYDYNCSSRLFDRPGQRRRGTVLKK